MYIIRETFTSKPGHASRLSKLFKGAFGQAPNVRIMTDMVADYNTVIMEMQVNSLAEFEKQMEGYKSGGHPDMDPEVAEEMSKYAEMYVTGKREIFRIE